MSRRQIAAIPAAVLVAGLLAGCTAPTPSPVQPTAVATAATRTTFGAFAVLIRVEPPTGMPIELAAAHLLTWTAANDDRIRIMVPTGVAAGGVRRAAVPADYHAYLIGLVRRGALITADRATTIDGRPAHRFTITSTRVIDGGVGCWADGGGGCFDLPPAQTLHVATVTVDGHAVVFWARTATRRPDSRVLVAFDRLLRTVHLGW